MLNRLRRWKHEMLVKHGYRRSEDINYLEFLFPRVLARKKSFSFVQIGANDGMMSDPLYGLVTKHHDRVKGVVVEPMRDVFAALQRNYGAFPNVTPVNVAIHASEREMLLYRIDPAKLKDMPEWKSGIASFDKGFFKLSGTPDEVLVTERVPCITLAELLTQHQVRELDLLQIDTEGYDIEIIKSIDFDRIRPGIIRFEHGMQAGVMSNGTFSLAVDILRRNGYQVVFEDYDATAYRLEIVAGD